MQLRFVSHSCIVIEAPGAVILCDPWLSGEVFNHGWQLAPPPLPLDDGELAGATHIFISHEHPDHLHFPTLASFPIEWKERVEVLFQKNNSAKVFHALRKIGYRRFRAIPHMREAILAPGITAFIYQHRHLDSALIVRDASHCIVNMNDAELTVAECERLRRRVGPIDVLLTQFSIAGSNGYEAADRANARNVLTKMVGQATATKASCVVPFASFMRFCKPDNAHLNAFPNNCLLARDLLEQQGVRAVLLYPGSRLDPSAPPAVDNSERYETFYASPPSSLLPMETPVAAEVLRETIVKRLQQWQRHYPALLLRKAGVIRFRIEDLQRTLAIHFAAAEVELDAPGEPDIAIYSQPLQFAFQFDFGVQTLGVSGRYRILRMEALPRWKIIRIVSSLYNAEIYLTLKGLFRPTMLAWIWQRKANLIGNIVQQIERFRGR